MSDAPSVETLLVSRSTTISANAQVYKSLMETCGMTSVQVVERDEEYGSVYVVYGQAELPQLARFAARECAIERNHGLLSR